MVNARDVLATLLQILEENGRLCFCEDNLDFLNCPPGTKVSITVVVEQPEKIEHTILTYEAGAVEPSSGTGSGSSSTPSSNTANSSARGSGLLKRTASLRMPASSSQLRKRQTTMAAASLPTPSQSRSNSQVSTCPPLSIILPSTIAPNKSLPVTSKSLCLTRAPTANEPVATESGDLGAIDGGRDELDVPSKAQKSKSRARDMLRIIMEAATYAQVPLPSNLGEAVSNNPLIVRSRTGKAISSNMIEKTRTLTELIQQKKQLDIETACGKLRMVGLSMQLAHLMLEVLREKGRAYDPQRKKLTRAGKQVCGRWDFSQQDVTMVLDELLQIQPERIVPSSAKQFMKVVHKGQSAGTPTNYEMRMEAAELWRVGKKACLIAEYAGSAALMFFILGSPNMPGNSMKWRFKDYTLCHNDFLDGDMNIIRQERFVLTAMADQRWPHWRTLMEAECPSIEHDAPKVHTGQIFYRDAFNKWTGAYEVVPFPIEEAENYTANRSAYGPRGIADWETHLSHKAWSRTHPCCAVWASPPPIQVFETGIDHLGKALRSTQLLRSGDYIAEHAGLLKPAAQLEKSFDPLQDRMAVTVHGKGLHYITQSEKWSLTKYVNHSNTPNVVWVQEVVGGVERILLRVKTDCSIWPGEELTVHYGDQYWEGKELYVGPRFLLH